MSATSGPPLQFTLRRAGPQDAGLLLSFMRKRGDYQNMADEITATRAALESLLKSGQGEAVFAFHDGRPAGFAFFNQTSSAFTGRSGLFIDAILVEPEDRQTGLGKTLMQFIAQEAQGRGGQMLEWGCMDWTSAAIGFYEHLGACCLDGMHVYRLAPDTIGRRTASAYPLQNARPKGRVGR